MNPTTPLALAIERRDWEAAALHALLAFARALRETPDATLEDLLAALTSTEANDDARGR